MTDLLRERIAERIRASNGRVTFAEFVEMALYDPDGGFFSRAPIGRSGHFVTSPHVSPVFARLLAEQIEHTRGLLGSDGFTVVEVGAGDGSLARQICSLVEGVDYVAVERTDQISGGADDPFLVSRSLDDLEPFSGVVIANELFDNIPFRLLRTRDEGTVAEVFVAAIADTFVEVEGPPVPPSPPARDWPEFPFAPAAEQIVAAFGEKLERGYVLVFDYGATENEPIEPIRGYKDQRRTRDLLAEPGSADITAPVDFTWLAERAGAHGLTAHGPVTQRHALHALGYRRILDEMRRAQASCEEAGDHRKAIELFGARNEAAMLVDPSGLGGLKVLGLATPDMEAPLAVR